MGIRKAEIEDSDKILSMLLTLDKETKFMMFEPDERPNNIRIIQSMISQCNNTNGLFLVAIERGNIIGFLMARRVVLKRIEHTVYIVTGVLKDFSGKGIGSKLFLKLDSWAKKNKVLRIELTVMCQNIIAKHLYEKNGFEIEGTKRKSVFIDGEFVDEYYMAKIY